MSRSSRRTRLLVVAVLSGSGGIASCGYAPSEPANCDWLIGYHIIDLQPVVSGTIAAYEINVRDSIHVVASVHRVDAATRVFNPQQGFSCDVGQSSPVSGVVTFSTTDTLLVRLRPGGWIHGVSAGLAGVRVVSTAPAASVEIGVLVHAP